jgi:hypothetical protein
MHEKYATIQFVSGAFAIAVVSALFLLGLMYNIKLFNDQYYVTMNHCIEVGGTWIPGPQNTASCILNNR